VKYILKTGLALAGLIIFILLCTIYAPGADAAKREMVVAAGGGKIYVLEGISGIIYELRNPDGGRGCSVH